MISVKALFIVFLEALASLVAGYLISLSFWAGSTLNIICTWILLSICGAFFSYTATVKGISNYIAWIFPPVMYVLGHYLAFFYLPSSIGPAFCCAFLSVVGAATGDVVKKYRKGKTKRVNTNHHSK